MRAVILYLIFLLAVCSSAFGQPSCPQLTPTQNPMSRCEAGNFLFEVKLNGSGISAGYTWYIWGSNGWEILSGVSGYQYNPYVTQTTNYKVIADLGGGCPLQEFQFFATINSPPAPVAPFNAAVCGEGGATLKVEYRSGYTYRWYENASGGELQYGVLRALSTGQEYFVAGPGNSELTITSTNQSLSFTVVPMPPSSPCGSMSSTLVSVTVHSFPSVSAGADEYACVDGGLMSLSGTPEGGTWSGTGVSGSAFDPIAAGLGTHTLVYNYTDPNTGCSSSDSKLVTVGPSVTVSPMNACYYQTAFPLTTGSPAGGTWTGNFVSANTFNAQAAGAGTHTVTYTYIENGCTVSKNTTVNVIQGPSLSVYINDPGPVCSGAQMKALVFRILDHSNLGSNYTIEWLKNGGNDGDPQGPGDTNSDIRFYDPYDETYGFQVGQTVQVRVTSNEACASPNPALSNLVTLTAPAETFPTVNDIQYNPNPICSGGSVTFTVSSSSGGNISGNWTLGSGGTPFTGSNFTLDPTLIGSQTVNFSGTVIGSCGSPQTVTRSISNIPVYPSRNPTVNLANTSICSSNTNPITAVPSDIGSFSVHYDWYVNNVHRTGNNSNTLSQTGLNNGDNIRVVMTIENPVCSPSSDDDTKQFIVTPAFAVNVVINDPGPICGSEPGNLVFQLDEGASTLGPNPTLEWFRNGGNDGNPQGPGDTNDDIKIYDPADPTPYSFQFGQTVELRATSQSPCASPNVDSHIVTITRAAPAFPTVNDIAFTPDPICEGAQIAFSVSTSTGGNVSGTWTLGPGGFTSIGPTYLLSADNILSMGNVNERVVNFSGTLTDACGNSQPVMKNTPVLTVQPRPQVLANNDVLCSGEATSINIASDIPGTAFNWTVSHNNVSGPTVPGSGPVISQALTSTTNSQGTATYTITSVSPGGCAGNPVEAIAQVNPHPINPNLPSSQFCDFEILTLLGSATGSIVDFRWYDNTGAFLGQGMSHATEVKSSGSYSYQFESISNAGCISVDRGSVTINVVSSCDDKLNWIETMSYGLNDSQQSEIVGHSKSYFDHTGKPAQSQTKNFTGNKIWLTQSINDEFGRPVISTLPALHEVTEFQYKHWLVTDQNGKLYDYTKFNEPVSSAAGTLGWYYSSNNSMEQNVPVTGFPYSRSEFYDDGSGEARRSSGPGEQHRLGMGHEVLSGTFPVFAELDNYLLKRTVAIPGIVQDGILQNEAVQFVSRDQNGKFGVSIKDKSGQSVMSCRAGTATDNVLTITNTVISSGDPASANYRPMTYFYILHDQAVTISGSTDFVAENIVTNERKAPGATFAESNGNWPAGFYRILLNNTTSQVTIGYTNYFLDVSYQFYDDAGRLKVSVSPNGYKSWKSGTNYSLIDKTTYEYNHQGWLLSTTEPDAGKTEYKYRKDGKIRFSQNAQQRENEVSQAAGKGKFSYTNYDESGRPVESGQYIGPNGAPWQGIYGLVVTGNKLTSTLAGWNNSAYSTGTLAATDDGWVEMTVSELTGYKWIGLDPQGVPGYSNLDYAIYIYEGFRVYENGSWITSATTTLSVGDRVRVERRSGTVYYRKNGEIIYTSTIPSTNSLVANLQAYGAGAVYENVAVSFNPFAFSSLSTELEYVEQIDFPSANKNDWVKTHYNNVDPSMPTLAGITPPDFLRGAVAWTENANIKTWYSYDEFGRVTWMMQKPAGLPRTFLTEYTYDFIGNVKVVKNRSFIGTGEATAFYHHYEYDKDQRLQEVSTSIDGTNKKLRATYVYYLHGPLKRIVLGDRIQGIDFVYNINGWLTQINHPDKSSDPGKDGQSGPNSDVKPDVFGMILDYYESALTGIFLASNIFESQRPELFHKLPGLNETGAPSLLTYKPPVLFFKDLLRQNYEQIKESLPRQNEKTESLNKTDKLKVGMIKAFDTNKHNATSTQALDVKSFLANRKETFTRKSETL